MFIFDLQSIVQIGSELTARQFPCPFPNQKKSGDFRLASGFENTKPFRWRNHQLRPEASFPLAS
ncbi:hypothetical protein ABID16_001514 [Rhizobium aquaticum]|uniref:Uncharacterized protein n=1 Tax=Rhizobium aquaticum TaxID=1549636 RepID=A0ABV2IZX4_9HYPH